jgi:hypothetical protein
MTVLSIFCVTLVVGLAVGLVMGLIFLCIDRRRKGITKVLNVKDGITLEYECSPRGIYDSIRGFFADK